MPHSITVSSCKTYIILRVTGTITREFSMGYNREAHALGKSLGIRNYLVDLTESQNGDTVSSNFRFANEDMKGGRHRSGCARGTPCRSERPFPRFCRALRAERQHQHDIVYRRGSCGAVLEEGVSTFVEKVSVLRLIYPYRLFLSRFLLARPQAGVSHLLL